ncbi:class D sortase [Aquibacillus rhizosphaerae]|uniref:Class D sortase n=1 Tax=Aquibacillus rhizosphaerae TaxID=3051431 RepID=A0ABT7L1G8_9BACI|nr:class D sortase [Aquibacillus sp. LR5S19]MDL4839686.1 class D sortase [Aquibacillus sp. LR5S19]
MFFGGFQFSQGFLAQKNSLEEAKELVSIDTQSNIEMGQDLEINTNFKPSIGETIGLLEIPSIQGTLPIIEGTNPDELEKGVGHYRGTAFPMQDEQIVLSGHRDTVFRNLGDVKVGDTITVNLPYGKKTYEMVDSKIVDANDRSIIKPTGEEELVITTCYPFSYVGNAPDRYILYAKPIKTD